MQLGDETLMPGVLANKAITPRLKRRYPLNALEVSKMSKSQDKRKESKKPATRTAKEKHQLKKAKQAEHAHREF